MAQTAFSLETSFGSKWSVVLIVPIETDIVAIARNFDPFDVNLPGGKAEYLDKTPADTAKRELLEETGLQAKAFELIDCWKNKDGTFTYSYKITMWTGKLRSSSAGKTFLATPKQLCSDTCTFVDKNERLIKKLKKM